MSKITKLMTAAGLLAGSVLINSALHAQEDEMHGGTMMENKSGGMMSGDSMSDKESNGHGMMRMMQEMHRMMENCNEMMEPHAEAESQSEASDRPAG